jgi:putative Na+/H+ antiporter
MQPTTMDLVGAAIFAIAIIHTFSTKYFERLAQSKPAHAGVFHLLGEVEAVFGFWAMMLVVTMFVVEGPATAKAYVERQNFTEPLFVFAIMVVAGSRPILQLASALVRGLAKLLPIASGTAFYFATLFFVPLLGSFITEPAAMTLAALILLQRFYSTGISSRLKYATLAVLFVNVSIGGTLTPYAAPPVLMVAAKWNWDIAFMFTSIGWKAAVAVLVNAVGATLLFSKELRTVAEPAESERATVPAPIVAVHVAFLAGIVVFAHYPALFLGLMLFFLGFAESYERHQDKLILREGLMVAFFLAGLVMLGGVQKWWLQPLLAGLSDTALFYGATALTAVTDNAALTYLGSLVEGMSDSAKYALVTGAVTGGGLTVIANAPNPAGFSILKDSFDDGAINPLGLFVAALIPTLVAVAAFRLL